MAEGAKRQRIVPPLQRHHSAPEDTQEGDTPEVRSPETPRTAPDDDMTFVAVVLILALACIVGGLVAYNLIADGQAGRGHSQYNNKGEDMSLRLTVDLANVYSGDHVQFTREKTSACDRCGGHGAYSTDDIETCPHCQGTGARVVRQRMMGMVQQFRVQCDYCGGRGKIISKPCPRCRGHGLVKEEKDYDVPIPRGLEENGVITLEEEADVEAAYLVPGDLHLHVSTRKHPKFERHGNDLKAKATVGLKEALLGFTLRMSHLDGHEVELTKSTITAHGEIVSIIGGGMIVDGALVSTRGDLYVEIAVDFPRQLSKEQKNTVRRLLQAS